MRVLFRYFVFAFAVIGLVTQSAGQIHYPYGQHQQGLSSAVPPIQSMAPPVVNQVGYYPATNVAPPNPYQQPIPQPQSVATGMESIPVPVPVVQGTSRIDELEARVAQLQANVDACQIGCTTQAMANQCCTSSGFYVGAAAVFAKPHFKEAFRVSQTDGLTGQQTLIPFEYDYEVTPRIFAGFRGQNGLGIRCNFWEFDHAGAPGQYQADGINIFGAHVVSIIFPANIFAAAPGDTLFVNDRMQTQILNLYGTLDGCVGDIAITAGAGLRYANLEQMYQANVVDGAGAPTAQLQWEREFNGIGPSVMVDASKPLGNTRLSFVASGGGSLLFGEKTLTRTVFGDQSPQPAAPFLNLTDADEVVGIGELALGLEWAATMRSGRSIRVRGSYEGQLWAEAGAPTLGFLGFEGFGIQAELRR